MLPLIVLPLKTPAKVACLLNQEDVRTRHQSNFPCFFFDISLALSLALDFLGFSSCLAMISKPFAIGPVQFS